MNWQKKLAFIGSASWIQVLQFSCLLQKREFEHFDSNLDVRSDRKVRFELLAASFELRVHVPVFLRLHFHCLQDERTLNHIRNRLSNATDLLETKSKFIPKNLFLENRQKSYCFRKFKHKWKLIITFNQNKGVLINFLNKILR